MLAASPSTTSNAMPLVSQSSANKVTHRRRGTATKDLAEETVPAINPLESIGRENLHVAIRARSVDTAELAAAATHFFGSAATDAVVHRSTIAPLVDSAFNGFNANIVCAGGSQTGKSLSMWGTLCSLSDSATGEDQENTNPKSLAKNDGLMALALGQTFDRIQKQDEQAGSFVVALSLFGINPTDQLVDYFTSSSASASSAAPLKLQESSTGKLQISGLVKKLVLNKNHAMRMLSGVFGNVKYSAEMKNSHTIVMLTLEKKDATTGMITSAHLKFVDLASAPSTGVNPSLTALEKVVNVLSKTDSLASASAAASLMSPQPASSPRHIPYRDSKLTRVLKEGLGCVGQGRTHTLFVLNETGASIKQTVKFASRLRTISNVLTNEPHTIPLASSLHKVKEQAQTKMKMRAIGASPVSSSGTVQQAMNTPRSERATMVESFTPSSASVSTTPIAQRAGITGVRRALFETPAAPTIEPAITELPVTAVLSETDVPVESTPKPTRRYAVFSTKASPSASASPSIAAMESEEIIMTPMQPSAVAVSDSFASSPLAAPPSTGAVTRRWKFGSARKLAAMAAETEEANVEASNTIVEEASTETITPAASPSSLAQSPSSVHATPTPTRRWTFKSRSGSAAASPSTPSTNSVPDTPAGVTIALGGPPPTPAAAGNGGKMLGLQLRRAELIRRLGQAEAVLLELALNQYDGSSASSTSEERSAEQVAEHLAHESAAMSQCEILRAELATMEAEIATAASSGPEEDEPVVFQLDDSCGDSVVSPAQFIADDIRGAFTSAAESRSDSPAREMVRFELSRLSIVAEQPGEAGEDVECEDGLEANDTPYSPLPSFTLPSDAESISDATAAQPDFHSTACSKLADLMRRSLSLPIQLRTEISSNVPPPASPFHHAHLNVVNHPFTPSTPAGRDAGSLVSPSLYRYQSHSAMQTPQQQRWVRCCRRPASEEPAAINDVQLADQLVEPLAKPTMRSSDEAENEAADLVTRAAHLSKLRKQRYAESSMMEKAGCSIQ